MITENDFNARGWGLVNGYGERVEPGLIQSMETHGEAPGLSSLGTRNVLHAFTLSMRPKVVLEIGSHIGSGAVAIGSALKANAFGKLYCLEPQDHYFDILSDHVDRGGLSDYVFPLKMLSTDPRLPAALGEKADIIYLDANHAYTHVVQDLDVCEKLLAPTGLLFLDDTGYPHSGNIDPENKGGVRRALRDWTRLRPDWNVIYFEHPFWLNPCGLAMASRLPNPDGSARR